MSLLSELIDEIDRYTGSEASDRDLETWLVSNLQRILDSGEARAIQLANEVDALLN